jgi:hypothetical protein
MAGEHPSGQQGLDRLEVEIFEDGPGAPCVERLLVANDAVRKARRRIVEEGESSRRPTR